MLQEFPATDTNFPCGFSVILTALPFYIDITKKTHGNPVRA